MAAPGLSIGIASKTDRVPFSPMFPCVQQVLALLMSKKTPRRARSVAGKASLFSKREAPSSLAINWRRAVFASLMTVIGSSQRRFHPTARDATVVHLLLQNDKMRDQRLFGAIPRDNDGTK